MQEQKNKILYIILMGLISLNLFNPLFGSENAKKIAAELKNKARAHEKKNEVYDAIYYYSAYLKKKPDDIESTYRLAKLYYAVRDYQNAWNYFDSLIIKDEKKYALAWYYHGMVSMNLEEYKKAIESFTSFRKLYRGHRDKENYRGKASDLISSAEWAIEHYDSLADVTFHPLNSDINGPHIEFAPFPLNETSFIYGSLVPDTTKDDKEVKELRRIYTAEKNETGWKASGLLKGPINHPLYHTGNAAVSPDGQRLYFTRCRLNWQNKEICEIYLSELKEGTWQEAVRLPYPVNNETYTSTQPSVGINPKKGTDILYFVSDRPGTRGGLDIWSTEYDKKNNVYKEPRNMGKSINSSGDDCCPFIDNSTGSVYFSSNGRNGFGGFDIYKTTGAGRKWADAEPLPKPVNSSFDDTYYASLNGTEGFFTSNRPGSQRMINGTCCDDIFYFKYNQCVSLPAIGNVFNITNRDIYEMLNHKYGQELAFIEDKKVLPNIPVKLFTLDNSGQEVFVSQTRTDVDGNYHFNLERNRQYVIIVENYGFFDKRITISGSSYNCDETIDLHETGINYLPEITVRFNIYYEHDKSRLTAEARTTIDTTLLPLFDLYPTALVEIGSHTDNTGTDNYNIKLSQRRSESVVNYLIEKGIDEDRLVAKGYGESMPIAPNTKPDGTDDPDGRQLNRRTEFKIIGSLNSFYHDEDEE